MGDARMDLVEAEQHLLDGYGVSARTHFVDLADPPLRARVLEVGDGDPLVLVHGSGMAASTWAPLLAELKGRRVLAVDLPGFGLSDPLDYAAPPGRALREHAVAQLASFFDALGLDRAPVVGTSLGAMWALCMALAAPERVSAVVALGMPAVALPGMHGDPGFTAMTLPVVGGLFTRLKPPSTGATRRAVARAIGPAALARTPDEWFAVVRHVMRQPGWSRAMHSHLRLAMRAGRQLPENVLGDDELAALAMPVLFVWGDDDVYGPPAIGRRAAALMPDARVETLPGGHAPFLDDPERCAALIDGFLVS